jgi:pyruvate-formate lyase
MDFTRTPNGATLDLKIDPSSVRGEEGIQAMVALMRSFIEQGGWFMQIDVIDSKVLRDAQDHPENYPNLPVRVSGWSARFVTLNKEWQDMIINRTQQVV